MKAVQVKAQAETYTENSHTHTKGSRCTGTASRLEFSRRLKFKTKKVRKVCFHLTSTHMHTNTCTHTPRTDCSRNSAMVSVLSESMERANTNSPSTSEKLSFSRARRRHSGCRTRDYTHTRTNTHRQTHAHTITNGKTVSLQPFPLHSSRALH